MFFRVFALLVLVAVAFANPNPDPQAITYVSGVPAVSYSGYAPVAYSAPYAAFPYAYNGYFVR